MSVPPAVAVPAPNPAVDAENAAPSLGVPLTLLAIATAEALTIAFMASRPGSGWIGFAMVHLAALGAIGMLLGATSRAGRDATIPLLGLIAGAAIGPIGLFGAACLGFAGLGKRQPSPLIADWYERIALSTVVDAETRLCDDVGVGRTLDLGTTKPQPFPNVMERGPLAERQTVLGLIARQFHPSYLETLKIALKSPEPSIRVQAAAVATHISPALRRRFHDRTAAVAAASRDPVAALGLLGELDAFINCGLLDATERQRGVDLAAHLGDRILEAVAQNGLRLPYGSDPVRACELEGPLEELLLSRGQFADFRAHRSARRIQTRHPTARMKRIAAPRRQPEVIT